MKIFQIPDRVSNPLQISNFWVFLVTSIRLFPAFFTHFFVAIPPQHEHKNNTLKYIATFHFVFPCNVSNVKAFSKQSRLYHCIHSARLNIVTDTLHFNG